jgi:hypothetical protein
MTMPRKFTGAQMDEADSMRARGMRWVVIEAVIGEGIKGACYYRDHMGYINEYNDELEGKKALSAWNGEGDRQSFVAGFKVRAKLDRSLI